MHNPGINEAICAKSRFKRLIWLSAVEHQTRLNLYFMRVRLKKKQLMVIIADLNFQRWNENKSMKLNICNKTIAIAYVGITSGTKIIDHNWLNDHKSQHEKIFMTLFNLFKGLSTPKTFPWL